MTRNRIEELIGFLPQRNVYRRYYPSVDPDNQIGANHDMAIQAYAERDPAFGEKLVQSYVSNGYPLHPGITELPLIRAHLFETSGVWDYPIRRAVILRQPSFRSTRNMVESMSIIPEVTIDEIAERCGEDPDTIWYYTELFWNVRDRLDDKAYLASLVFPDTRQIEWKEGYLLREKPRYLMLRAAWNYGQSSMEYLCGLDQGSVSEFGAQQAAQRMEATVLSSAAMVAKMSSAPDPDIPTMRLAARFIQASKQGGEPQQSFDEDRKGLGAASVGSAVIQQINGLVRKAEDAHADMQARFQSFDDPEQSSTGD